MIKSYSILLFSVFVFVSTAFSQKELVNQSTQWFALTSNIKVSKKLSVLAEGQFRFVGNLEPMQFQARTGVDIAINKHLSIMPLAYVYCWNPIYGKQPAAFANNEHRIFQQALYSHRLGRFYVSHRGRLEQRFLQVHQSVNGEVVSEGYTLYLNRFRYRLNVQFPLNHQEMVPKTFYAATYDEGFVDFGGATIYTDPDQNRFFLGLGYKFDSKCSLQAGFFTQALVKLSGTKQENNTGFQVQLVYNIDLTK